MHFGLLVIHAWTPNSKNSITADHVVYNFVRLKELEKNDDLDAAENAHEKNLAIDSVLTPKGIPSYFQLNTNLAKIVSPDIVDVILTLNKNYFSFLYPSRVW